MTEAELERLQALVDGATEGPWEMKKNAERGDLVHLAVMGEASFGWLGDRSDHRLNGDANAAFIAASRTAMPELIAEVKRLRGALEKIIQKFPDTIYMIKIAKDALEGEQ